MSFLSLVGTLVTAEQHPPQGGAVSTCVLGAGVALPVRVSSLFGCFAQGSHSHRTMYTHLGGA